LVPPDELRTPDPRRRGLAAFAGYLEAWDDLPTFVEATYEDRQRATARPGPDPS
jgi:hypothetical protein